jgi:hypothetical protein
MTLGGQTSIRMDDLQGTLAGNLLHAPPASEASDTGRPLSPVGAGMDLAAHVRSKNAGSIHGVNC